MPPILQNPDHLSYEEVVSEIVSLQDEIRIRGRRIYELSHSLYRHVRRNPTDDNSSIYINYANNMTRFAGAIEQVLRRTIRTARVLERKSEIIESAMKKKLPSPQAASPVESLIDSYMEQASVGTSGVES